MSRRWLGEPIAARTRSGTTRRVFTLSIANLAASGSGLLLFVLAARVLTPAELGQLALLLAASQAVVLIADAGLTGHLIRSVSERGDMAMLRWVALRRLAVTLVVGGIAAVLITKTSTPAQGLLLVGSALSSTLYAAQLAALQGADRHDRARRLQFANALLFTITSTVVTVTLPSAAGYLGATTVSYVVLLIANGGLWREAMTCSKVRPALRSQAVFAATAVANALTSTADTMLLATRSRVSAGEYAGAQRPGLAFAAVSNSLIGTLLPQWSGTRATRPAIRLLAGSYAPVGALCFIAGVTVTPLLNAAYGDVAVAPLVVGCVFAAYGGGLVSTIMSVRLLAAHREWDLAVTAWIQMGLTIGLALALLGWESLGVAFAVLLGRIVGFAVLTWLYLRHLLRTTED